MENANAILNTRNMEIKNTTFSHSGESTLERVCIVNFKQEKYMSLNVTLRDDTYIKNIMDLGYAANFRLVKAKRDRIDEKEKTAEAIVEEDIRKMEAAKNSPAIQAVKDEIECLAGITGFTFTLVREKLSDDGSYLAVYSAPGEKKPFITFELDGTGTIISVRVEARYYKQTAEWIKIKDAVLQSSRLALSTSVVSQLTGTFSTQSLTLDSDGYRIQVFNVDNFTIWIHK